MIFDSQQAKVKPGQVVILDYVNGPIFAKVHQVYPDGWFSAVWEPYWDKPNPGQWDQIFSPSQLILAPPLSNNL